MGKIGRGDEEGGRQLMIQSFTERGGTRTGFQFGGSSTPSSITIAPIAVSTDRITIVLAD